MDESRDKLIEVLAKYFDIGDSYAYNLTRVKEAFAVGTVTIDDFVEFDDEVVADIADHLLADKDTSRAFELLKAEKEGKLILPPCKVGDTVYWLKRDPETFGWHIRQSNVASILIDNDTILVYISPICWIVGTDIGKTVFLTREEAEKALREKEK